MTCLLTGSYAYIQGCCPGTEAVPGPGAGHHLTSMTFMHFIDKEKYFQFLPQKALENFIWREMYCADV